MFVTSLQMVKCEMLVISLLEWLQWSRPLVLKFAGSNLAEAIGFLGRKNPQHAFLWRGSKAISPMS